MGRQLETVESPFSQIALSLAKFLDTGEYVDTTGVAKVNFSPKKSPRQRNFIILNSSFLILNCLIS